MILKPRLSKETVKNIRSITQLHKGKELYKNFFVHEDHERISKLIKRLDCYWMVTYDDVDAICGLYKDYECKQFDLTYSVANSGKKSEIMFLSDERLWPSEDELKCKKIKINIRKRCSDE